MDSGLLVTSGRRLLELLDGEGMRPRIAIWMHDPDIDSWKLWLVPDGPKIDEFVFYKRISKVLTAEPDLDLSTASVRLMPESHPAIVALQEWGEVSEQSVVALSTTMLGGYFMTDGIILRLRPKPTRSETA